MRGCHIACHHNKKIIIVVLNLHYFSKQIFSETIKLSAYKSDMFGLIIIMA